MPVLSWVLTGKSTNTEVVSKLIRPARIHGYARFSLKNRDYPGVVKHYPESTVDGYLLKIGADAERQKLDEFEGMSYKSTTVTVSLVDDQGRLTEDTVEADMYIWAGAPSAVTDKPWDLDTFVETRLENWLELFEALGSDDEE